MNMNFLYKSSIAFIATGILLALTVFQSNLEVTKDFNGQALTVENSRPVAHINATLTGYYLFSCVPIVASDPIQPDSSVWFEDTIKSQNVVNMLTVEAKRQGANRVEDLWVSGKGDWLMQNRGMNIVSLICFGLLWVDEVHACGNAVIVGK